MAHNVAVAVRQARIIMAGGRPAGTREKGFLQVARDDWKYYDDDEEMREGEEESKTLPPEMQCGNCLHWVQRDTVCCPWCAKVFDEKERRPR